MTNHKSRAQSQATIPGPVPHALSRAEKIALWFVSASAFVILGFLYTLHGDVRALQGQNVSSEKVLSTMDARIGEFKDRFNSFDRRFDQIDKGITEVKTELGNATAMIRGVMSRQYIAEADPESLAEQMGYKLGSGYKARFVESRLYLFPQTAEAENDLRDDGRFERVQLSPVLFGYEIKKLALSPPGSNNSP